MATPEPVTPDLPGLMKILLRITFPTIKKSKSTTVLTVITKKIASGGK
jgi:hypothetical protein